MRFLYLLLLLLLLLSAPAHALSIGDYKLGLSEDWMKSAVHGLKCQKDEPPAGRRTCNADTIPSRDPKSHPWNEKTITIEKMSVEIIKGVATLIFVDLEQEETTLERIRTLVAALEKNLGPATRCPLKEIRSGQSATTLQDARCEWTDSKKKETLALYFTDGRFVLKLAGQ